MILVSAIVFMVFIETTQSVRDETLAIGETTRQNIGSGLHIQKIYAQDGSANDDLDFFFLELKVPYASEEIKLTTSLVTMALPNTSREYTYNSSINCSLPVSNNSSESVANSTHTNHFGASWIQGSATYADTVSPGEYVRLCFKSPRGIVREETIGFRVLAKFGLQGEVTITAPSRIYEKNTYLFP
jgi:archaellin